MLFVIFAVMLSNVIFNTISCLINVLLILDVTLTYEIIGRPEAVRPIPGETVTFTCDVEGSTLTWISPLIDGGIRNLLSTTVLGTRRRDSTSGEASA